MSGRGERDGDGLRVGGWVYQHDPLADADPDGPAEAQQPEPLAGDVGPGAAAGDPEPGRAPAVPERGRVRSRRARVRGPIGTRAKAVAGAAVVAVILAILAVAAYESTTHDPAAGPAGYGSAPGSRAAVPPAEPSAAPAPPVAPSGSPSDDPSPSPSPSATAGSPTAPAPTATAEVAAELLANGGFESGTLAGWSCANKSRVVSSPVHTGRYALAGDANVGHNAQCSQTVAVQPGRRYTLSAWVSGAGVYLGVSGAGLPEPQALAASVAYTQLRVTFVAPAGGSVTVWVRGAPGTYYADDLSLS
jgi:Carbohydrate binding domain